MTNYPRVYVHVLKQMGYKKERINYCRESTDFYTIYVFEYLYPYLKSLRSAKRLTKGKHLTNYLSLSFSGTKKIIVDGKKWSYTGELNSNGLAYGKGVATGNCKFGVASKYVGSFLNDQFEGIGKYIDVIV